MKTIVINVFACAVAILNELTGTAPSELSIAVITILNVILRMMRGVQL